MFIMSGKKSQKIIMEKKILVTFKVNTLLKMYSRTALSYWRTVDRQSTLALHRRAELVQKVLVKSGQIHL